MSPARIWERDGTIAAIERLLNDARSSHGRSLFIVAEPGLGKTTMIERAQELGRGGFQVGIGRGDAAESTLPFGIIDQALRALRYQGALGNAEPGESSGLDARASRWYAALQFLEEAAKPTLLLLDDLHWADDDSLALLSFLCRRIGGLSVAVLGALRPWRPAALEIAQRLARDGDAAVERLQPLSESGASALLDDRTGRPVSTPSARRAAGMAGGNPLLLEQVAFNIKRGKGVPEITGDTASIEAGLLRSRFTGISADESRYAQAASVLGNRFRPSIAGALAELPPDAGDRALEALCRGGLFKADGANRSRFTHPMLRKVVYEDIPAPVRSGWHTRAFRLLVLSGADPAEAAEHASRADLSGDPQAIAILTQAGRAAMKAGAIARARQRLSAAVEIAGTQVSAVLLMELGEALLVAGDGRAAGATYRRVLSLNDLPGSIRTAAQRMLGRALFIRGAVQDAGEAFREAVASALPDDRTSAVEALLDQAFTAWPTGGPALARPLLERARELAAEVSPALRLRATTAWAFSAFISGDPAGIAVVDGAVHHAFANPEADTADFSWSWGTLGTYGNLAKWTERFDDATRAYDVGIKAAERMGLPVAIAAVAVMHADTCVRTGQLRLALELADRATLLADLAPERAFWAAITHAYVLADMGHMDECSAWWRRASELADPDEGWAGRVWLWHIEAVLAMHARKTEEACSLFDRVRALADRLQILEPCVVPWSGDAITAYLYSGRLPDALAIIESLEVLSERFPCRLPRIVVAGSRAALAQVQGDTAGAQRLLEEALRLASETGMPVMEARLSVRLGAFLRRRGEDRQARPFLARALELAETAGAESVALKAREELKLAGGRRARPRENPDALTMAEDRVRRLAVQGLRTQQIADQLFVSVNTIETHLQHIYRKLGINSWHELVVLSRRQESAPAPSEVPSRL